MSSRDRATPAVLPVPRTALTAVLAVLAALGLVRVAGRLVGLAVLLGVVVGCVVALTAGVLLLRAATGL